jgi:hypothetical protein
MRRSLIRQVVSVGVDLVIVVLVDGDGGVDVDDLP